MFYLLNVYYKSIPKWQMSAQKVDHGEENSPAGTQTLKLLITSPVLKVCFGKASFFKLHCSGVGIDFKLSCRHAMGSC